MTEYLYSAETDQILGAFYRVYNELGYGFLEKVYKQAMLQELRLSGIDCQMEYPINVYYRGSCVGEYYADIVVSGKIILELKAAKNILPEHEAQILNYLRATNAEVGLLLNFGPSPQQKRFIYTNNRKRNPQKSTHNESTHRYTSTKNQCSSAKSVKHLCSQNKSVRKKSETPTNQCSSAKSVKHLCSRKK